MTPGALPVAAALAVVLLADVVTAAVGVGPNRHRTATGSPATTATDASPSGKARHSIVRDVPATLGGLSLDVTATRTQFSAADVAALQRLAGAGSRVDLGLYSGPNTAIAAEAYTRGTDPDAAAKEVLDGYVAGLRLSGQAAHITYPDRTDVSGGPRGGLLTCGSIRRQGSPYGSWCAWVDRSSAGSVLLFGATSRDAKAVLAELRSAVEK